MIIWLLRKMRWSGGKLLTLSERLCFGVTGMLLGRTATGKGCWCLGHCRRSIEYPFILLHRPKRIRTA